MQQACARLAAATRVLLSVILWAYWNSSTREGKLMALAEIRKSKGLSQRQLAEVSGVNVSRIADIERGRRDMRNASFATAVKLADALKLKDLRKLLEP